MNSSEVIRYKDFLDPREYGIILNEINKPNWEFGNLSLEQTAQRFWGKFELENNPFFSVSLFNKIKWTTYSDFDIERIYMNGHTGGSHGNVHQDSFDTNSRTFLIYCNETWSPEHGGGTTFICDDDNITTYPHPLSAVYFPGIIPHFAAPISNNFKGLRVTLAFKLILK
jgi:hypothetical protein